jgi:hypothetical protein
LPFPSKFHCHLFWCHCVVHQIKGISSQPMLNHVGFLL